MITVAREQADGSYVLNGAKMWITNGSMAQVAVVWAKTTIILDEPTAALGAKQTAMVYDVVRAAASEGLAVLIVSHDIPKMIDFADRLAIMRLGHVVEQMPTKDAKLMDVMTKMLTVINQSGAA